MNKKLAGDRISTKDGDLAICPVNHATFVMQWKDKTVYVDPVGGGKAFASLPKPDLILITHTHFDHLDADTLAAVAGADTVIVGPQAAADALPSKLRRQTTVMSNNQAKDVIGLKIEALPMYNLTPERLRYHPKGQGNSYVITLGGKRVYISGDTEGIPEMRALKDIDVAFVCMNLPYTMDVEQAARVVREFKPKIVYPYHCRGSDLQKFEKLVGADLGIEVRIRDWYK